MSSTVFINVAYLMSSWEVIEAGDHEYPFALKVILRERNTIE